MIAGEGRTPTGVGRWFALKGPFWWTVAWLVVGLPLNMSWTWLYQQLWVLNAPFFLLHLFWGLAQVALFASMISDGRRDVRPLLPIQLLLMAAFFFGSGLLSQIGDKIPFVFLRPAYDRVVADAANGRLLAPGKGSEVIGGEREGLTYAYHSSRPDLVTFGWVDGIPDGGVAIVFDGSDSLREITEPGIHTPATDLLLGLFGEEVQRCFFFAPPHYFRCGYD